MSPLAELWGPPYNRAMRITLLLATLLLGGLVHADTPLNICVKNSNGKVTAEQACPSGTRKFSEKSYSETRGKILYVAAQGAQFKTIEAAILKATALQPTPEAPLIIRVAPGTFNITSSLLVPANTHIVGSGIDATTIVSSVAQLFFLGNNNSLRDFSINWTPASSFLLFLSSASTGVRLENLKIEINSSSEGNILYVEDTPIAIDSVQILGTVGIAVVVSIRKSASIGTVKDLNIDLTTSGGFGVNVDLGASVDIANSKINITTAPGTLSPPSAIRLDGESTRFHANGIVSEVSASGRPCSNVYATNITDILITNSRFKCTGDAAGTLEFNSSASGKIFNSQIEGDPSSILIYAADNSTVKIANSHLNGGSAGEVSGGSITCSGVTDENFTFSQSTCP